MRRKILWIDGLGAASAGAVVLLARGWLSEWYGLPLQFVTLIGVTNLAYSAYSLPLATWAGRPMALVLLLAVANLTWAALCLRWALVYAGSAGPLGLIHLVGEGLYVGGLACLEWRWRDELSRPSP